MIAAVENRIDIARALIHAGADLNLQTKNGGSALHWASQKNNTEMATMLLEAGIDSELKNQNGKSALDLATTAEMMEILSQGAASTNTELKPGAATNSDQTRANPSTEVTTTGDSLSVLDQDLSGQ